VTLESSFAKFSELYDYLAHDVVKELSKFTPKKDSTPRTFPKPDSTLSDVCFPLLPGSELSSPTFQAHSQLSAPIGLGFAYHQHPRHFVCPGLGVIHISREAPRGQHAKRRAANFNASPSPVATVQTSPYQYTGPTVGSPCELSVSVEDLTVPIGNAFLDEGWPIPIRSVVKEEMKLSEFNLFE
jgi:hypothetical protein